MEESKKNEVTITKVPIKKSEDIKNFAESTMNELLGWYGYESPRQETKTAKKCRSVSESNDSEEESVKFTEGCGWCGKTVDENTSVISAAAVFCSELCFSQSRRASFKRNKTCDWCRHARHTVSYVDFQDNAAQLQFCSDKCLNQYKMHIFCRETQAHLELHPHLHGTESASGSLITPDLWLKNCASPKPNTSAATVSPKTTDLSSQNIQKAQVTAIPEPLPLISVAPSAKLLATDVKRNRSKRFKKGCPSTITSLCATPDFDDIPQDLRVRQTPPAEEVLPETYSLKINPKVESNNNIRTSFDESSEFQKHTIEDPVKDSSRPKLTSSNIRDILGHILPPPTTFVPYPIILPLPIPIPIPLPIPKMFKSNNGKDLVELKDNFSQTDTIHIISNRNNNDLEEKHEIVPKKETTEVLTGNRRLLRKRKHVDTKPKVFLKPKKTVSTLP